MARLFRKAFAPLLSGLEHVDRHYGLGLLVADCIGARVRMGLLYRKAITGVFDGPHFGIRGVTPSAPSPTLIITPDQVQGGRRQLPCAPCCASIASSQDYWVPHHVQLTSSHQPPRCKESLFVLGEKRISHQQGFKNTARSQSSGSVSMDLKPLHFTNALLEAFDLVSDFGSSARYSVSSGSSCSSSDSSKAVVGAEPTESLVDEEPPFTPSEPLSTPPRHSVARPPMLFRLLARSSDSPGSALSSPALSSPALSDASAASAAHKTSDISPAHSTPDIPDTPEHVHPAISNPYNRWPSVFADAVVSPFGMRYQIPAELGEGAMASVKMGVSDEGEIYALKVMSKRLLFRRPNQRMRLAMEKMCMQIGRENRIDYWVRMSECWHDENNVYFVLELGFGSLRERMTDDNGPFTPTVWCWQMLKAVEALRDCHIIHSDIKPDNFLIVRGGSVVLSDFGLARTPLPPLPTTDDFLAWRVPFGGTPGYLAPETLPEDGYVSHASDVFSLGVVFAELLGRGPSPLWDVYDVPPEFAHAQDVWEGMHETLRQQWLMDHRWLNGAYLPEGSMERDICEQMLARELLVDELLEHSFFAVLFDEANAQYLYRPDVRMSTLRVARRHRDLTFAASYRPLGCDAYHGAARPSFGPVMDGSRVVVSRWLKDNENARQQLAQPFPEDFDWMYTPPDVEDDEDDDEYEDEDEDEEGDENEDAGEDASEST